MDSCENVTFLVLRNTWFLTIWEFFPNSHSKMFFNKIEIVMVFDWLQPCTGYIAYKKPFCLIFRIPTLRLLSSHWSGLLIRSLIGPSMMTGHMTLISDFPILSLTYTVESVNVRLCYLLLLFTIYLQYLFTFRRCGENIKYKDFALNCRQSVFRELKWIVNQTTLKNDKLRISWKFRNFKLYNPWRLL